MATYYKLAVWDERCFCFRDGKRGYDTIAEATADATKSGKYRISQVTEGVRTDLEPFDVVGKSSASVSKRPAGRASITSLVYGRRLR